jgi:hypothetical protein
MARQVGYYKKTSLGSLLWLKKNIFCLRKWMKIGLPGPS